MKVTRVKSIFISIKPIVKVVQDSFGILNLHCIMHRQCSTNGVSFTRKTITFCPFTYTGATTSQKQGIYEIHKHYGC